MVELFCYVFLKNVSVLFNRFNLFNLNVFGSCFRTLAVVLVADVFFPYTEANTPTAPRPPFPNKITKYLVSEQDFTLSLAPQLKKLSAQRQTNPFLFPFFHDKRGWMSRQLTET